MSSIDETDSINYSWFKAKVIFDSLPMKFTQEKLSRLNPDLSSSGQLPGGDSLISLENIAGSKLESMPLG